MSKLLFSLRGVPDDEADEIIAILKKNHCDFYETSAGNWGVSVPALWVTNNEDYDRAQNLLNEYHHNRAVTQRKLYEQSFKEGKEKKIKNIIKENTFQFFSYTVGAVLVIYISIKLVLEFGY